MNERDKKLIEACNNDTLYDFISNYGYQFTKEELIEIVKQLSYSVYQRLGDQAVEVTRLVPDNLKEYNFFGNQNPVYKVEYGHSIGEYMDKYGALYDSGTLWNFPKEELEDGTVEPQEDMTYWEIDGRLYETSN